jgi:predicted transcriptional regulator
MEQHIRTIELPKQLYRLLQERAKAERRSANAEIVVAIAKHVEPKR